MKKPVKIILWSVLGLFLLLVVALLANPLWLGPVVKTTAKSIVPGMTGCEFELKDCSLNLYTGKFRMEGLNLKNPKGYDEPSAVSFESLDVELDMGSLATKKIHVVDITLEKPFVSYVFDKEGTNNFDRILAYLQSKQGPKEEQPKEEKQAENKDAPKVLIDRLAINGTKVKYRMITLPIPVPTLTKIGYGKDDEKPEAAKGATFAEAGEAVWTSVKDKFTGVGGVVGGAASAVTEGAANALKGAANLVGAGADSKVGQAATKAAEATTGAVKDGAKAATGAVKDGAKAAADTAAKAAEATTDAVKDGAKAVGEGLKKLNPFGK